MGSKRKIYLIGQKFERLLVVEEDHIERSKVYYKCLCDCGNEYITGQNALKSGKVRSCGCLTIEKNVAVHFKHGMCETRIYSIWRRMLDRCELPNNPNFKWYGGKGIKVCERWHNFENFYNDTKEGYSDVLTLDRYPNKTGNYQPNNFRWATWKQQARNKTSTAYLEYNGETLSHIEWSEKLGFDNYYTIPSRLKLGWSIEKTLTEPINLAYSRRKTELDRTTLTK